MKTADSMPRFFWLDNTKYVLLCCLLVDHFLLPLSPQNHLRQGLFLMLTVRVVTLHLVREMPFAYIHLRYIFLACQCYCCIFFTKVGTHANLCLHVWLFD